MIWAPCMSILNSCPVNGAAAGDCDGYIIRATPARNKESGGGGGGGGYIGHHTSVEYWLVFKVISQCCPLVVTTTLNY